MFCIRCGRAAGLYDRFCQSCGQPMNPSANQRIIDYSAFDPKLKFRSQFGLTFIFALGTAFFWVMQFLFPEEIGFTLFGGIAGLLSLVARLGFLVSFLAKSSNWLAVSAISSTTSLFLGLIGTLPFGAYPGGWPTLMTWIFSLSTLVTYAVQARKAGMRPYVVNRKK